MQFQEAPGNCLLVNNHSLNHFYIKVGFPGGGNIAQGRPLAWHGGGAALGAQPWRGKGPLPVFLSLQYSESLFPHIPCEVGGGGSASLFGFGFYLIHSRHFAPINFPC